MTRLRTVRLCHVPVPCPKIHGAGAHDLCVCLRAKDVASYDFNFFAVAFCVGTEKSPLGIGGTNMPARVVFVQQIGSGYPMPEGIAEYSGGVIVSTKADIRGYGFANVGILLDDDTFNKLALAMIEANTKKAIKAFEAAIQACIEQQAAPPAVSRRRRA